jgi:hypothetical protein
MNHSQWNSLKPYIYVLIEASLVFVALPLCLVFFREIEIVIKSKWYLPLVIAGSFAYLHILFNQLIPGIKALFDYIGSNFLTCKAVYLASYTNNYSYFLARDRGKRRGSGAKLKGYGFYRVLLARNNGKKMFLASFPHLMEKDKVYTIKHGKFSKVIVSIVSEQGEEMLQFDVD